MNTVMHVKGYAAPETKAVVERTRLLIEQTAALGEPPDDPLLLYSVPYGMWITNLNAFNGDAIREIATQFLALAKKQGTTAPLLIAHRLMGLSLLLTGDTVEAREHQDQAIALYDPAAHRPLATRFGVDARATVFSHRSWTLWCLGYPAAALADADQALKDARALGHAATLMNALAFAAFTSTQCGNYPTATALLDELIELAEEKGAMNWKASGLAGRGRVWALSGKAVELVRSTASGLSAFASTGTTVYSPMFLSALAGAYAKLGQVR